MGFTSENESKLLDRFGFDYLFRDWVYFIVSSLVEEGGDSANLRVLLTSDLENLDYSLFGSCQ